MSKKVDIKSLYDLKDKDLSKLSDEEITDIMMNVNKGQLKKIGIISIYDSFYGSFECMDMMKEFKILEKVESNREREKLKNCYDKLLELIYGLSEGIEKEDLNIAKSIRMELYELLNSFKPYTIEIAYVNELANHYFSKNIAKDSPDLGMLNKEILNKLYLDITKYLAEDRKDYYVFSKKISTITRLLPFRMTKEKFTELIEDCLRRNLSKYPEKYVQHQIREYKRLFDGSMEPAYGTKFDNYFRRIQELKQIKFKALTLKEAETVLENSEKLSQEIEEIDMFIRNLGILNNKLIVIYLINSFIKDVSLDEEIIQQWKKSINSCEDNTRDKLKKKLRNKISELEKELFSANEILEKVANEAIERQEIIDEQLNEKLLFTKKVLGYYNDIIFENEEMLLLDCESSVNLVEKNYLEELLSNFIQYINRSISLMSNIERKFRMKRLLSIIEFPFEKPENFANYIQGSLDPMVTSEEEILIAINNLYYLMNMEN